MRAILLPLLTLAACAPMYGAPPEHLHPVGKPIVHTDPIEKAPPPVYVEQCTILHDTGKPHRAPAVAQQRVAAGDAKLAAAAKEQVPAKQAVLFTDGIQQYRAALVQDPFDADATIGLARAYDNVLRKGCALKLLDRLAQLAQNPKISPRAKDAVQAVQDHDDWFKDYRSAAKDAVLGVRTP